jgi:cytochrome c
VRIAIPNRAATHAIGAIALGLAAGGLAAAGDPERGARAFRACVACHVVEPGQHLTGPSLAGIFGRKAGSVEGFARYSEALRSSAVVWDERALDAWLRDPARFIPGNAMTFPGMAEAHARADLIAYLRAVSEGKAPQTDGARRRGPGQLADLRQPGERARVAAVRYCGDTYYVTTAAGETRAYWEFNLRFKTDSSARGPASGQPVLVGGGMMGDRAQLVFAHPGEIAAFVKMQC